MSLLPDQDSDGRHPLAVFHRSDLHRGRRVSERILFLLLCGKSVEATLSLYCNFRLCPTVFVSKYSLVKTMTANPTYDLSSFRPLTGYRSLREASRSTFFWRVLVELVLHCGRLGSVKCIL